MQLLRDSNLKTSLGSDEKTGNLLILNVDMHHLMCKNS